MLKELYTAALGMLPQQMRLELTANNIANANTVGFKRSAVFEQSLIEARENLLNVRGDAETEDVPLSQYIDFRPGALQKTGNPLDLALDNPSHFFIVAGSDGTEYLSRAGHFTIDDRGFLVTPDGRLLLSNSGPIRIDINQINGEQSQNESLARNIRISPQGEVQLAGQYIAQLRIVEVANPTSLERRDAVCFTPTDSTDIHELDPSQITVQQGYLEASNVDIVREMVTMIQLQRMFELGQKVIHTNDSTLDRSIDIGRFTA
ncbi:MAG: flagellar hook-basal body protein [Chlorobi bacterium]|nr:flagellar hook-basal body protein [Chlorobiota bacterium]